MVGTLFFVIISYNRQVFWYVISSNLALWLPYCLGDRTPRYSDLLMMNIPRIVFCMLVSISNKIMGHSIRGHWSL